MQHYTSKGCTIHCSPIYLFRYFKDYDFYSFKYMTSYYSMIICYKLKLKNEYDKVINNLICAAQSYRGEFRELVSESFSK